MLSLQWSIVDSLFIVAYGMDDPLESDWDLYMQTVLKSGVERTKQLIYTEGGRPTPPQANQLNQLINGRYVPVAVLSNRTRVRVVTSVMSWFNNGIRGFNTSKLVEALEWLDVPNNRHQLIGEELDRLIQSLRIAA